MEIEAIKRAFISGQFKGANLSPRITECSVINLLNLELVPTIYEHYRYPQTGKLLQHIFTSVIDAGDNQLMREIVSTIKTSKFVVDSYTVDIVKYIAQTMDDNAFMFSVIAGKTIIEQALPYDLELCLQEITKGIMDRSLRPQALSVLNILKPD